MVLVLMSKKELNRIEVLARLSEGRIDAASAAQLMRVSERQVFRLLKKFRYGGAASIAHRHRGRRWARRPTRQGRARALGAQHPAGPRGWRHPRGHGQRGGDVWVEGTSDYSRFDSYLVAKDQALDILTDTALPGDCAHWLKERRRLLDDRLERFQTRLRRGELTGVCSMANGRFKITPHDPVTPPKGKMLDRRIDSLMPRVRITELLWDVAGKTGFLDCFRDLRSGKTHENPAAILAAILAGATNLGLERMAQAAESDEGGQ